MKIPVFATILCAVLTVSCATTPRPTMEDMTSEHVTSEITPEVLSALSNLLSKNPDLREAYLVTASHSSSYALIPVFDGSPNMISLYESIELFKKLVPGSQLNLALLTPASRKRMLGGAEPFYVRP